MAKPITHEQFIHSVWALVMKRKEITKQDFQRLARVKLTYGTGEAGLRGATYYDKWQHGVKACGKGCKSRHGKDPGSLVTLCATGQESVVQLIGTTLHEAAHACAGVEGRGHGKAWKEACERVGLPAAVNGTAHDWDKFDPAFAKVLRKLPVPNDGKPRPLADVIQGFRNAGVDLPPLLASGPLPAEPRVRPCSQGFGTRGGTSRGAGAGSRMLKYVAEHKEGCDQPKVLRCAGAKLTVTCDNCKAPFKLDEASLPPSHGMGQSGQGVPAATAIAHGARKPHAPKKRAPKAATTPKAQRRKAATEGQAPVAPVTPPDLAPPMGEDGVFTKAPPKMCEPCNAPVTACPKPAGECEA